jgi:hypothetical protein
MHVWDINKYPVDGWWTLGCMGSLWPMCVLLFPSILGDWEQLSSRSVTLQENTWNWHNIDIRTDRACSHISILTSDTQTKQSFKHLGFVVTQTPFQDLLVQRKIWPELLDRFRVKCQNCTRLQRCQSLLLQKDQGWKNRQRNKDRVGLVASCRTMDRWTDSHQQTKLCDRKLNM